MMIVSDQSRPWEISRYPPSFSQQRLFATHILRPDDPALNATMRWRVRGELSNAVLERAWNALAARHEMLRTRFVADGDRVEQVVESARPLHVANVDCSALDPAIVENEVARIAASDARTPFDVANAPLWRLTRVVLSSTDSVLLVTAHQLACDGWSFGLLARELGSFCASFVKGEEPNVTPLTTTHGTFARWQRTALTDEALAEELRLLRADFGGEFAVDIPTDLPRPQIWTSRVETRSRILDQQTTQSFIAEARTAGSTPFMAMLAVVALVLRERTPSQALAITTQVVGRDDLDLENVVGPFVNAMPLRLEFAAASSLSDVLDRVGEVMANALELRHVPFDRIAESVFPPTSRDRGCPCAINFLYQKAFTQDIDYGSFRIESEHSRPGGTQYDLNIYVVERPAGWRLSCDYNPDLFMPATIEAILDRFEQTLSGGIDCREPALFFHSDLFADGFYAEEVAIAITKRRIIPIGPHGIGDRPYIATIDAMAEDYVAHIDSIQPTGPYRLLGFCSGALVAFEVARLLRERGERVEQLVLINATAPVRAFLPFRDRLITAVAGNSRLSPRLRESICYNVARFNRALLTGPNATARFLRDLVVSLIRHRAITDPASPGETFVRARGDAVSELSLAHIGAALSHRPHKYDGHVTLVWSVDQTNLTGESTQGWDRLAKSVTTVPMSGGHVAPLHELVGELSTVLGSLL